MAKFILIRSGFLCALGLLTACTNGPEKYTEQDMGPVSARARNYLVDKDPNALVRVGFGFEQTGHLESALGLYRQALAADPNSLAAKLAIARIDILWGHFDKAEASLKEILAGAPNQSGALRLTALIYEQRGSYQKAIQTLKPLLNGVPKSQDLIAVGRYHQIIGDKTVARMMFEQAQRIDQANGDAQTMMALSFALEGAFETSVALLQNALSYPAFQEAAKKALAVVYALSGQADAAYTIAATLENASEADRLKDFYQILPQLTIEEQSIAIMLNKIPLSAVKRLQEATSVEYP